jgi:hypothetical protein
MNAAPPAYRPLGLPLALAILAAPGVFVWLLLRPGYSGEVRLGAFAYGALTILSGLTRF